MMPDPLSLILSAAALGQAALCAGLLVAGRTGDDATRPAHRLWLAALFAALAPLSSGPVSAALAPALFPLAMGLVLLAAYALAPLVWLYVIALTNPAATPARPGRWKHALPGLAGASGLIAIVTLPGEDRLEMFVAGTLPDGAHAAGVALWLFALVLAWNIVSGIYGIAILRRLGRYRARLRDLYSNTEGRALYWLSGLIAVLAAVWVIAVAVLLIDNLLAPLPLPASLGPVMVLSLIAAFALNGFGQEPGLPEADAVSEAEADKVADGGKYQKSALGEAQAARIADKLSTAMREQQLFLDPGLSLQKLSRQIGVAPNLASQTLNQTLEETFFDYVNRWRVEAALPRIAAGEDTVLTIALDVGFNTRSTFYTAFKKVTGMTPRACRDAASTATD